MYIIEVHIRLTLNAMGEYPIDFQEIKKLKYAVTRGESVIYSTYILTYTQFLYILHILT